MRLNLVPLDTDPIGSLENQSTLTPLVPDPIGSRITLFISSHSPAPRPELDGKTDGPIPRSIIAAGLASNLFSPSPR